MERCFTFQWGRVAFQMGGFIFKWGVHSMGGSGFYGGFLKKIVGWGWAPPMSPPTSLWETLNYQFVLFNP